MTCVYILPPALSERLESSLRSKKNRADAMSLALYLARHWSGTRHLGLSFPIDRRALAERSSLGMTEARIRGALAALEAVGFLARQEPLARYQRTAAGPHRRPILFQFGEAYLPAFEKANRKPRRIPPSRPMPVLALTHKQPLSRGDLLMGEKPLPPVPSPLIGLRLSPEARRRFA